MNPVADRFAALVVAEPGGCHLWGGARRGGYGHFRVSGSRTVAAHRMAWELFHGSIPTGAGYHGICVCRRCDNRLCVNPRHLFLGSHLDNMRDRDSKGRRVAPSGVDHWSARRRSTR